MIIMLMIAVKLILFYLDQKFMGSVRTEYHMLGSDLDHTPLVSRKMTPFLGGT